METVGELRAVVKGRLRREEFGGCNLRPRGVCLCVCVFRSLERRWLNDAIEMGNVPHCLDGFWQVGDVKKQRRLRTKNAARCSCWQNGWTLVVITASKCLPSAPAFTYRTASEQTCKVSHENRCFTPEVCFLTPSSMVGANEQRCRRSFTQTDDAEEGQIIKESMDRGRQSHGRVKVKCSLQNIFFFWKTSNTLFQIPVKFERHQYNKKTCLRWCTWQVGLPFCCNDATKKKQQFSWVRLPLIIENV